MRKLRTFRVIYREYEIENHFPERVVRSVAIKQKTILIKGREKLAARSFAAIMKRMNKKFYDAYMKSFMLKDISFSYEIINILAAE